MKRSVAALIIMAAAGGVGFFVGAFSESALGGAILFSMIAGIACIVDAIDAGKGEKEE